MTKEIDVVRLVRNGKECFYITSDLTVQGDILTFHIDNDFYMFEFSILAYHTVMESGLIDCTKLREVKI